MHPSTFSKERVVDNFSKLIKLSKLRREFALKGAYFKEGEDLCLVVKKLDLS